MTKSFQRLQVFISMDSQFVVVKPTHCKENALWRIQDLSDGRAPSQRWECQPIIRPNFPTNCMKTRKHSSRMRTTRFYGWGEGMMLHPVWSHVPFRGYDVTSCLVPCSFHRHVWSQGVGMSGPKGWRRLVPGGVGVWFGGGLVPRGMVLPRL